MMLGRLETVGETLEFDCSLTWVAELIAEGAAGELKRDVVGSPPTVHVRIEAAREPFKTQERNLLTRGAWSRDGEVVVANACTSGFDVRMVCSDGGAEFTYRWRPPPRDRAAARVLRSRFQLLARAVLMQYPALWWAGTRGRVPLHASACVAGASIPLITAPSGVGRSTLFLQDEFRETTGDNLAVGDGTNVWGLVEPMRVEGAVGRKMPHGRNEAPVRDRVSSLAPDAVVVIKRGDGGESSLDRCSSVDAARSLVTSTYMAGELRRYWAFAGTLSAGTALGPPHPPITDAASAFAARLPCLVLELGRKASPSLSKLLAPMEVGA